MYPYEVAKLHQFSDKCSVADLRLTVRLCVYYFGIKSLNIISDCCCISLRVDNMTGLNTWEEAALQLLFPVINAQNTAINV
jgi:hypothetical protein